MDDRWEVGVSHTSQDGTFMQVSFVNSICTSRGGTHVETVANQMIEKVLATIAKKNKKLEVKKH